MYLHYRVGTCVSNVLCSTKVSDILKSGNDWNKSINVKVKLEITNWNYELIDTIKESEVWPMNKIDTIEKNMADFWRSVIKKILKHGKSLSNKTNRRRKRKTGLETINRFKYQCHQHVTRKQLNRVKLRNILIY